MRILVSTYTKAIPFPLAPLQAIRQHESGVVVITKPPKALDIGATGLSQNLTALYTVCANTHKGVGFPTCLAIAG
jgi:hypothetical protein